MERIKYEHLKNLILRNRDLAEPINDLACYLPMSYDDDNIIIKVPYEPMVCPDCEGKGTELQGGLKGLAFTQTDIELDPEFIQDMCSGRYDVACKSCKGSKIFKYSPKIDHLTDEALEELFLVFTKLDDDRRDAEAEAYYESRGEY